MKNESSLTDWTIIMTCKDGGGCSLYLIGSEDICTDDFGGNMKVFECRRCKVLYVDHPIRGFVKIEKRAIQ